MRFRPFLNIVSRVRHSHTGGARSMLAKPPNEPMGTFMPGSAELTGALAAYDRIIHGNPADIPCVVGGEEIFTGDVMSQRMPSDHERSIAVFHRADEALVAKAIAKSLEARREWEAMGWEHRAAILLRAADLAATKYRPELLATTMAGQAKTLIQAEVDATCELVDFFRFGAYYAQQLYSEQPAHDSPSATWNRMQYRPLEGFVASVTPFNFTAIGGNLAAAPALMGNAVLWKPSDTAMLSNYLVFRILTEAGMPRGVINFLPSDGPLFGKSVTESPDMAALLFTGSVATFRTLWAQVAANIEGYRTWPRLIGECGGKNFHMVHPSADMDAVVNGTVRAAFEYSGQKCSACSRIYVPASLWPTLRDRLVDAIKDLKVGQPNETDTFTSAVIDARAYERITDHLERASTDKALEVLAGGTFDDSKGYFINPTLIQTTDPKHEIMTTELFGPVLTCYVYEDKDFASTLELCDKTSPFGLTGSIFALDRTAVIQAMSTLRHAAGNFYINDKSTGSVVGQQPFGGARSSGTNDKAGGPGLLSRLVSPMSIKETLGPLPHYKYPYMTQKEE